MTTKGNVGFVSEYTGEGIENLTVPERATITNMGAETGVTTSIFPSDHQTKRFLDAQGRGDQWIPLAADKDATYDRTLEIDLSEIEPLAALPHSPGNIAKIKDLNLPVDQVMIGSCTNSSYVDLMTVAEMVKRQTSAGRRILGHRSRISTGTECHCQERLPERSHNLWSQDTRVILRLLHR